MNLTNNKKNRIDSIDAARGAAMLFVFIAHFGWIYSITSGSDIVKWTAKIGMVASPTFIVISGIMLGFLYKINENNFEPIKEKLIDRGLFLLTIGHFLIMLAHVAISGSINKALRWGFITDAIGISIIIGPLLANKIDYRKRLILGLFLYIISWGIILFFSLEGKTAKIILARVVLEGLFGTIKSSLCTYNFPLIPWLGFYLMSNHIGEKMGEAYLKREDKKLSRIVLGYGVLYLGLAIAIKGGYKILLNLNIMPENYIIHLLTSPFQKLPPSPVYFLFYGGVGILIMFFLIRYRALRFFEMLTNYLKLFGQASLFIFIIQYFIYFTIMYYLNLKNGVSAGIFLITSVITIYFVSKFWLDNNLNKLITVKFFENGINYLINNGKIAVVKKIF